jgi:hypothetical protein
VATSTATVCPWPFVLSQPQLAESDRPLDSLITGPLLSDEDRGYLLRLLPSNQYSNQYRCDSPVLKLVPRLANFALKSHWPLSGIVVPG